MGIGLLFLIGGAYVLSKNRHWFTNLESGQKFLAFIAALVFISFFPNVGMPLVFIAVGGVFLLVTGLDFILFPFVLILRVINSFTRDE